MNRYLTLFLLFVVGINIFYLAWYPLHGDIFFQTDIARDFLLLEDLALRKIVLIGPRSGGLFGMFHGPSWMYINLPVFLLSKGNPVASGWFWVLLFSLYLAVSFNLAKNLFDEQTAYIFITLLSLFPSIPDIAHGEVNGFYNPFGAMFLMPLLYYLLVSYLRKPSIRLLAATLLVNGFMIQFQIAFGGPLLILSTIIIIYSIIRSKRYFDLYAFLILLIPFSTYILFDVRHGFSHIRSILHLTGNTVAEKISLLEIVKQRLGMLFITGPHFFEAPHDVFNLVFSLVLAFGIYFAIHKKKENRIPYYLALYLYIGYFVLSCAHNGWLMYYYWFPIYPLVFFVFASLHKILPKKLFFFMLVMAILPNLFLKYQFLQESKGFIGKHENSWKFQSSLAQTIFKDAKGHEFGFFIYSPDIFAYQSKYPFVFAQKQNPQTKMNIYTRKPLTYLVLAPAPLNKPWMTGDWWKANKVGIRKPANKTIPFENGYVIERYDLTEKDLQIPSDQNLNDWIYFR